MSLKNLQEELIIMADKKKAAFLQKYFKTRRGEYGYGDIFLGITVPESRKIAHKFAGSITLNDSEKLLKSKIHEERFVALEILVFKYEKGSLEEKKEIYDFYLKNTKFVNNWDLVDTSAPYIFGEYLVDKDRKILYRLAKSNNIWERRISIVSTFAFIKRGNFSDSLRIAEVLINDKHDLIHKATGWMLREIGKKNQAVLEEFLKKHKKSMPRTTLRYAIERFPENKRREYLKK